MTDPLPEDLTFEHALEMLVALVERLENEELSLDESVALFEQGQQLTTFCQQQLDSAELRVKTITDAA